MTWNVNASIWKLGHDDKKSGDFCARKKRKNWLFCEIWGDEKTKMVQNKTWLWSKNMLQGCFRTAERRRTRIWWFQAQFFAKTRNFEKWPKSHLCLVFLAWVFWKTSFFKNLEIGAAGTPGGDSWHLYHSGDPHIMGIASGCYYLFCKMGLLTIFMSRFLFQVTEGCLLRGKWWPKQSSHHVSECVNWYHGVYFGAFW